MSESSKILNPNLWICFILTKIYKLGNISSVSFFLKSSQSVFRLLTSNAPGLGDLGAGPDGAAGLAGVLCTAAVRAEDKVAVRRGTHRLAVFHSSDPSTQSGSGEAPPMLRTHFIGG